MHAVGVRFIFAYRIFQILFSLSSHLLDKVTRWEN